MSKATIPVPIQYCIRYDDTEGQDGYYSHIGQRDIPDRLRPNIIWCQCGHELSENDLLLKQRAALLFTSTSAFEVDVFYYQCSNCNATHVYDGRIDKILNVNDKILIHHDIFLRFQSLRFTSTTPMNAYVLSQYNLYLSNNSIQNFLTAPTFDKYYKIFASLQGWNRKLQCLQCFEAGQLPSEISFDGTGQIIKETQIKEVVSPKETTKCNDVKVRMKNKIKNIRKVYIEEDGLRGRVEDFIIANKIRIYKFDDDKKRKKQPVDKLLKALEKSGYIELAAFIEYIIDQKQNLDDTLVKSIGNILRALSSYTLLNAIIPNSLVNILKDYSNDNWCNIKDIVGDYSPHLYSVHEGFLRNNIQPPQQWIDLVLSVSVVCDDMITELCEARKCSPAAPKSKPIHQSIFDQSAVSGTHYGYTVHHTRPTYDFNSEKMKKRRKQDQDESDINNANCNKYYNEYTMMSNGIIVVKCAKHEECMGWHILKTPESVNDCFSVLMMIYPGNTAPSVILCDNACQLHRYCMYREPIKFKYTLFLNDEFHAKGHKCGPLYNIKYFKDSLSKYAFLNDSDIEQTNSKLKLLRLSTSYMNLKSFSSFITQCLEIVSRKAIQKTAPIQWMIIYVYLTQFNLIQHALI